MKWRRLPLISTSVSLGERPRSAAVSVRLAVSPPKAWKLSEGRLCASTCVRSCWPTACMACVPTTCTGAALSAARMPVTRVPVTMMSDGASSAAGVSCAMTAAGSAVEASNEASAIRDKGDIVWTPHFFGHVIDLIVSLFRTLRWPGSVLCAYGNDPRRCPWSPAQGFGIVAQRVPTQEGRTGRLPIRRLSYHAGKAAA